MQLAALGVLADERHRELRRQATDFRLTRTRRLEVEARVRTAVRVSEPAGAAWLAVIAARRYRT